MRNTHLWWQEKTGDAMASAVVSAVHEIRDQDGNRHGDLDAWESIYNDQPCREYSRLEFDRDSKSRLPVLPGMVDSTLSRIGRARPLPTVLTTDGNWSLKRKAKLKTKWLTGMFKKLGVHQMMVAVLRDALVLGTGVVKTYYDSEAEEIRSERVWPGDLFVSELEAKHDCVRTMYQVMAVDRQTLIDQYPRHKSAIEAASGYEPPDSKPGQTDFVEVVEAWRLGTKTTPGKHAICVADRCLFREDYKSKRFPFEFLRWRQMQRKFWGQGMIESGAGLQSMINKTAWTMEECFRFTFPAIFYQEGSGFQAESLSNEPWVAYPYKGTPPQFVTPPPFSTSYYEYLEMLTRKLFETQGVSELAASSHKPAGLNSGKALLVFQDVESERFLIQGRAFEDMHVSLAERVIEIAEDVAKTKPKAEALRALGGRRGLEAIDYNDFRFGDAPWEIQVYPVTSLSHTPSGRLEQIQELLQMGIIQDPAVARELLDYPDLERWTSVEGSRRDLVEKMIDHALDKQEVMPANPYVDLEYAVKRGTLELNLAEMEGAPEKSMEALREFIGHCTTLIEQEQEQQAAAMAMAAPPPGPGGLPGPGGPPVPPPEAAAIPEIPNLAGAV